MKASLCLKILIVLSFTFAIVSTAKAQEEIFQKDEGYLWLGHGIINSDIDDYIFFGDYIESSYTIGALFMKYEYALSKKIGLGLTINYLQTSMLINNPYSLYSMETNYNSIGIISRFNRHFYVDDKFDAYLGFGAGYQFYVSESLKTESNSSLISESNYSGKNFTMEFSLGARFKLTDGICFYSEVGATKSLVQFGMTFKL